MTTIIKTKVLIFSVIFLCAFKLNAQPNFAINFNSSSIGSGSVSRLNFVITNTAPSVVNNLAVTNNLPAAISIASVANVSSDCTGVMVNAPDNGSVISFSGASVAANSSCNISVNVTSTVPGTHTNLTGSLTSSAGNSGIATADLTVAIDRPSFSKSFSPAVVGLGAPSKLTFTIDNSANASALTLIQFNDVFPAGMIVASPNNLSTTCPSGTSITLSAVSGSNQVSFSSFGANFGGFESLAAGSLCTISVDVVAGSVGDLVNESSDLRAASGGSFTGLPSGFAVDALTVIVQKVILSKEFIDDPVAPGSTVTLRFNVLNRDRNFPVTNMAFTDDLTTITPALSGMTFASLLNNNCGGTITGVGGTTIGLTTGNIAAGGSCSLDVSLSVPSTATSAEYINTTSTLTGNLNGSPFVTAAAVSNLFVQPIPVMTKTFIGGPVGAGSTVDLEFTISNTSTTFSATDINFTDVLTTFLPFPVNVTLPASGFCGAGSVLSLSFPSTEANSLSMTGGTLAPAGMVGDSCTFTATLSIPDSQPSGVYTNTTSFINATINGVVYSGVPASDDLTVYSAPLLRKEFVNNTVLAGDTTILRFTISHDATAPGDATAITFTDDLSPLAGLIAVGLPLNNVCGSGSSISGTTNLTFTAGSLIAGASCTFDVPIQVPLSVSAGTYTNTTSAITARILSLNANGDPAVNQITIASLDFSKTFLSNPVLPGATVDLQFSIDNLSSNDATSITFIDNLNDILPGAPDLTINGALPTNPCGAGSSITGTSVLVLTGGNLSAGSNCTFVITLNVPATTANGNYNNITSNLTTTIAASTVTAGPAVDTLTVSTDLLLFSKTFTNNPVAPGGTAILEFSIQNLDLVNAASSIAFTDDLNVALPGLVVTGLPMSACGGALAAIPDSGTIDFSGGSLAVGASCTFQVNLTVPSSASISTVTNTTSGLTAVINGLAATGTAASDDLSIKLVTFSKSFDGPTVASGTPVLTYTITNLDTTVAVNTLGFSDDLNAVIPGLLATGLPLNNTCGSGSLVTGASQINLTGASLPASASCSFSVPLLVPATAMTGTYPSTSDVLSSGGLPITDAAVANLVVEPPPTFTKVFAPNAIGLNQTSIINFTIDNSASAVAVSGLAFTDNFPAGMQIDATPAVTNTCAGTLTANSGASALSLSGGTVTAGGSCNIQVTIVASSSGSLVNTTGDLTSSSGNSGTASDTLTVNSQPVFAKSFASNPMFFGSTSTLDFTIDNSSSSVMTTSLNFTDNLPTNMVIATPSMATSTCTGGTLTAIDGSNSIAYVSGSVNSGNSCIISVNVTTNAGGSFVNTSGNLTSSLGNSGPASDTLIVNAPPIFTKQFNPATIVPNAISQLSFNIDNTNSSVNATSIDFTDNFPTNVVIATPANVSNSCTGGSVTAVDASTSINYTNGSLNAGSSCTITVDVTSANVGNYNNITGDLTSNHGNSGQATDALLVSNIPVLTKSFVSGSINAGGQVELVFTINNAAAVQATLINFTDDLNAFIPGSNAVNLPQSNVCGAGSSLSGTSIITLSNGVLAANSSCQFSVMVSIPINTLPNSYVNVTSPLTTDLGGVTVVGAAGSEASANLMVNAAIAVVIPLMQKGMWLLLLLMGMLYFPLKKYRKEL